MHLPRCFDRLRTRALSWYVNVEEEILPVSWLSWPPFRLAWLITWPGGGRLLLLGWLFAVRNDRPIYAPTLALEYTGWSEEDPLFVTFLQLGRLGQLVLAFPLTPGGIWRHGPCVPGWTRWN